MSDTKATARVTWPLGFSLGSGRSARERDAAALVGTVPCRVRMRYRPNVPCRSAWHVEGSSVVMFGKSRSITHGISLDMYVRL